MEQEYIKNKNCYDKKTIPRIKGYNSKYDKLKMALIKKACLNLKMDFTKDYYMPEDFDYSLLDEQIFKTRNPQEKLSLPLSNDVINTIITAKKIPINNDFMLNNKGKNIYGTYLVAEINGKVVLYALTILRGTQNNNDNLDFSIKLDACIYGKAWLPLLRFDAVGFNHPNYLEDGKILDKPKFIPTPHLHRNCEETQVLFFDKLDYTLASNDNIPDFKNKFSEDKSIFKDSINYFLDYANINLIINKKIENNYNYNFKNRLIEPNTAKNIEFEFEILGE